ncbi:VWA domain-containing protein [Candidatus Poriferisodalis sp.]|uniref:VWA domain-containing protein n=1 Tax=Candidatus Poriferisodalis sp. TaxID=3101277 RepID=UPI003C704DAD
MVVALLALCLLAAACTSTDDADADGTADVETESTTAVTASPSSDADERMDEADDEEERSTRGGAASEEATEQAVAGESDDMAVEEMYEDSSSSRSSSRGRTDTESAQSAEPEHEPYQPTSRRRTEPDNFVDYGINPFVDTADDPFSTFALDVDTASYTIARNFLDGGQMPPFEAVRVEEFVNYFDGGYDDEIDEFTISVEAASSPFVDSGDLLCGWAFRHRTWCPTPCDPTASAWFWTARAR